MKRAEYYLLDVFTDQPFAGNQLAVFMPCDALASATMQALARELNLAETVFLGQPRSASHYPMRIFTPAEELDFAGHPTIGTALLLAELGLVERSQVLTLAPPVGELATEFVGERATFTTARPAEVSQSPLSGPAAAALLGLQAHQVIGTPVIASCGLAFHLIELADTTALGEVCLSATHWDDHVSSSGIEQVYLYVGPTPGEQEAVLRTRMFCREHGLCEDAATGSAQRLPGDHGERAPLDSASGRGNGPPKRDSHQHAG